MVIPCACRHENEKSRWCPSRVPSPFQVSFYDGGISADSRNFEYRKLMIENDLRRASFCSTPRNSRSLPHGAAIWPRHPCTLAFTAACSYFSGSSRNESSSKLACLWIVIATFSTRRSASSWWLAATSRKTNCNCSKAEHSLPANLWPLTFWLRRMLIPPPRVTRFCSKTLRRSFWTVFPGKVP